MGLNRAFIFEFLQADKSKLAKKEVVTKAEVKYSPEFANYLRQRYDEPEREPVYIPNHTPAKTSVSTYPNTPKAKEIGISQWSANNKTDVVIPEGVTSIGGHSFFSSKVERITFPKTLKEIEKTAFWRCDNLREIVLPEGLETIGEKAFWECRGLERVVLPSTLKELPAGIFDGCSNLKEVVFSEGLTKIGDSAFSNCT